MTTYSILEIQCIVFMMYELQCELNTVYKWGYFLLAANLKITGLVCSAYNSEGICKTSESKVANGQAYGWLSRLA